MFVADLFKPRRQLEVENLFLRHQLNIALRRSPRGPRLRGATGRCWAEKLCDFAFVADYNHLHTRYLQRSDLSVVRPIMKAEVN